MLFAVTNIASDPAKAALVLESATAMLQWRMRHTDHRVTHLSLGPEGAAQAFPTLHEALKQAKL